MDQLKNVESLDKEDIISKVKSSVASSKNSFLEVVNNSKTKILHKSAPTILADDIKIEGEIVSSGIIEVEGYINGTIKANNVTIRENGSIEGTIISDHLNIKGKFNGAIQAKQINFFNKSEVSGSIEYEILSVEDGASIDGQFKKISNWGSDS